MKIKCKENEIFEVSNGMIFYCDKYCNKYNVCRPYQRYFRITEEMIVLDNAEMQSINNNINSPKSSLRDKINNQNSKYEPIINKHLQQTKDSDDVIINVGAKQYKVSQIEDALLEIFTHWNTDAVFKDQNNFKEEFDTLLKIKFPDRYQIIKNYIFIKNSFKNNNIKFFYLFYKQIYLYLQSPLINKFYFCDGYQIETIIPLFDNKDDLFEKINRNKDYLIKFIGCQQELLDYLYINDFDSLLRDAVVYINNNYHKVGFFQMISSNQKYYQYIEIDTITHFIDNLYKVEEFTKMKQKLEFLKLFKIENGKIIKRTQESKINEINQIEGKVDKSIYDFLKISSYNTSQSKDMLKVFLTLLNEYLLIKNPSKINFGSLTLDVQQFYLNVVDIIHNAYAKCSERCNKDNDLMKFYLMVVLKKNHILNYFIDKCQNTQINELLDLIDDNIKYEKYLDSQVLTDKYIFYDSKRILLKDYFNKIISNNDINQVTDIINNNHIYKLLKNKLIKNYEEDIKKRIKNCISEL